MTSDWRRLADLAARRRADLGISQAELAQRGPLSIDRVQAIEGAKRDGYRLGTLAALERGLKWESGSVEAILDGGDPTPLDVNRTREGREARTARLHRELNEEREKLRELTERLEDRDVSTVVRMVEALIERDAG